MTGESGLFNDLHDAGITINEIDPDYVIAGKTKNYTGVHFDDAEISGERMDTDMIGGIESGMDPILVLSGVTSRESMKQYPYRPRLILNGAGDIPTE